VKVVLVIPPFSGAPTGGGEKIKHGKLRPLPPLGLGYLAAELEAHGHEVSLVDSQARQFTINQAVGAILAKQPNVVGLSSFTVFEKIVYAMAAELKARDPKITVIIGGPHATSFHETILEECPHTDFVVPGEAEIPLAQLVDALQNETSYADIPGVIYRNADGSAHVTPPAEPLRNLDQIRHPNRHIFEDHVYIPLPNQSRRSPATTVIASRGCPWAKCRFCYQGGKYASPYRRRSPENLIEELRYLVNKLGFREVIFWDDNFCVSEKWINTFCDLLDKERLDLTWTVQGRVNTVTRSMLQRIAASGCYNVFFGFEFGCQELLDLIKKGITLEQSRQAVNWANEAGLEIRGAFMLGLPTETPEMAQKTIKFACELDLDYLLFMPYHVQRGTALEEIALREGGFYEYEEFDWHAPSYVPNAYTSPEELAAMIRLAYTRYYLRPRYIARALWHARRPAALRNVFRGLFHWYSLTHGERVKRRS